MSNPVSAQIKLGIDTTALNAAKQGLSTLEKRIAALTAEARQADAAARKAGGAIGGSGKDAERTAAQLSRLKALLQQVRGAYKELEGVEEPGSPAQRRPLPNNRAAGFSRIAVQGRTVAGTLGGAAAFGAEAFGDSAAGLRDFAGALGGVSALLTPAGIAMAALGVATALFNVRAQEAAQRYKEISDATLKAIRIEEQRNAVRERGTSEGVQKDIETLTRQRAVLQEGLRTLLEERVVGFAKQQQNVGAILVGEAAKALGAQSESLLDLLKKDFARISTLSAEELVKLAEGFDGASAVAGQLSQVLEQLTINESELANVRAREARQLQAQIALQDARLQNEARAAGRTLDADGLSAAREALQKQVEETENLIAALIDLGGGNEFAQEAIRGLNEELGVLLVRQRLLESETAPLVAAREREAQATREATAETQRIIKALEDDAAARRAALQATSEGVAARRAEIVTEIDNARRVVERLRLQGGANEEAQRKIEEYTRKIEELSAETDRLTRITEPLVRQREREAQFQQQIEQRNAALTGAVLRYEDDVARIEEDAYKQRASVQQRYNDDLVNIAKRAADDAATALARLQERRAGLLIAAQQAERDAQNRAAQQRLDAQINYQRDEAKAASDHAQRLQDIQRNAQRREQDLILSRDFAGLFRSRRDTGFALEDANREAQQASGERAAQFRQQQADAAAAFEQDRQQRAAKFAQDLADAAVQYAKERALAEQKRAEAIALAVQERDAALQAARDAAIAAQNARKAAFQQELADIADFGRRKAEVERAALERGLQLIGATIDRYTAQQLARLGNEIARAEAARGRVEAAARVSSGGGGVIQRRASGGAVQAGQSYLVNEPNSSGREGFNNTRFPPSLGLFIPQTSGTVNKDMGGSPISLTFNVTGTQDPQLTAQAIQRIVLRTLQEVVQ